MMEKNYLPYFLGKITSVTHDLDSIGQASFLFSIFFNIPSNAVVHANTNLNIADFARLKQTKGRTNVQSNNIEHIVSGKVLLLD